MLYKRLFVVAKRQRHVYSWTSCLVTIFSGAWSWRIFTLQWPWLFSSRFLDFGFPDTFLDFALSRVSGLFHHCFYLSKMLQAIYLRCYSLMEANLLHWRKYLWHCWKFLAPPAVIRPPHSDFGARGIAPSLHPLVTPLNGVLVMVT